MPTSSLFWSNCYISVKLIPRNGDKSLGEFGDDFKDPQIMQLTEFYRNIDYYIKRVPDLIASGIFTYNSHRFLQA